MPSAKPWRWGSIYAAHFLLEAKGAGYPVPSLELGALLGYAWQKQAPQQAEEYTFPVASGVIAGGSLMGVILVFWENGGQMLQQLFGI